MQDSGLEQVFLENRPKLLRFVRARLGDEQEAEDCLQDIWVKIGSLETGPIADPLPYLFRMVKNAMLDNRRAARRRAHRNDAWLATHPAHVFGIDEQPSAEQRLLDRERLQAMEDVLAHLPERTSTAFRMFRLEGIAQKLIARHFDISVSAVEKHLQRAYHAVLDAQAALDAEMTIERRPAAGKETGFGKR